MKKIKIDHEFEVPEGMVEIGRHGGYPICTNSFGVFVCGKTQFNLTVSPIQEARIIPLKRSLHSEKVRQEADKIEGSIENLFEFEEDQIYYQVLYGEKSYIFSNLYEALGLIALFVGYKSQGLETLDE